jgi:hypothetical protein
VTDTAPSRNGIRIRLTDERWAHISGEHGELTSLRSEIMETVAKPMRILAGDWGELLAVGELEVGKYIVVVYRELERDGFIITAFLTRRFRSLERRKQLWP